MSQDNSVSTTKSDNAIMTDDIQLTDEIVLAYLQENESFFNRQSEFLTSLRLPDEHRGTVSLVERTLSQQRQQIHQLQEEITHLMAIATQNEKLFDTYSDIYLQLIDCKSIPDILDCLFSAVKDALVLNNLKLWFSKDNEIDHDVVITNDCQEIIDKRLKDSDYYFGRLQQQEQLLIFSQPTEGSVVLMRLTHNEQVIGFLTINSQDAEHFDPRMDTLLLNQFKRLLAKLLYQQLNAS